MELQQHHRRQCAGSSKTMFESPNTQPLIVQEHHRHQRDGSSKTMFEPPNTRPRILREHHRRQRDGSSKAMFKSPITQPQWLREHHLHVQELPETIVPTAWARRLIWKRCTTWMYNICMSCVHVCDSCMYWLSGCCVVTHFARCAQHHHNNGRLKEKILLNLPKT